MARQQRTRDEQETTITYDSGEGLVRIYTARPTDVARMRKAGVKAYDGNDFNGFRYKVPLARLFWKIRPLVSRHTGTNSGQFQPRQPAKSTKVGVSGATPAQA